MNEKVRKALTRYFQRDFSGDLIMPMKKDDLSLTTVGVKTKNTYHLRNIPGSPYESIHFFALLDINTTTKHDETGESIDEITEPKPTYAVCVDLTFSDEQQPFALQLKQHFDDLITNDSFPLKTDDSEELICEYSDNLVALNFNYTGLREISKICEIAQLLVRELETALSGLLLEQEIISKPFSSLRRLKAYADSLANTKKPKIIEEAPVTDPSEADSADITEITESTELSEEPEELIAEGETILSEEEISNEALYEQILSEYEASIDDKDQRIQRQEKEILQLKAKLAAMESAYASVETEAQRTIRLQVQEKEFFPNETRDLFLRLAREELVRIEGDKTLKTSRRADLLRDIIAGNEESNTLTDIFDNLKNLLSEGKEGKMLDWQKHEMELLGFLPMESNKEHFKVTFHGDPRYTFVLASTESDIRGKRNFLSGVRKKLS